jgi:hypothetical protein
VVPWECALCKGRAVGHPAVFTVSTMTPWPRHSRGCAPLGAPLAYWVVFAGLPDLNYSAPGESDAMSRHRWAMPRPHQCPTPVRLCTAGAPAAEAVARVGGPD